jgi:3-hydroxyisobutyryl-CoA hydrolase
MSGVGGKAFCAGGDIKLIYESGTGKADPKIKTQFFHDEYVLDYCLTHMNPIQISIWNGIVMGGGVGVSVHAPIRVATDNSVYAMPETGIGFFTDVGGSYFLSRINHNIHLGLYLGLTG